MGKPFVLDYLPNLSRSLSRGGRTGALKGPRVHSRVRCRSSRFSVLHSSLKLSPSPVAVDELKLFHMQPLAFSCHYDRESRHSTHDCRVPETSLMLSPDFLVLIPIPTLPTRVGIEREEEEVFAQSTTSSARGKTSVATSGARKGLSGYIP